SLLSPHNLQKAVALAASLRRSHSDTIIFFHHFTTRFGSLKFAALSLSAGSPRRIGLDNGNGFFLTERLPDLGFGVKHQAQYWLDLVAQVGAESAPRPAQVKTTPVLREELQRDASKTHRVAIHAGGGSYSLARRWEVEKFAAV